MKSASHVGILNVVKVSSKASPCSLPVPDVLLMQSDNMDITLLEVESLPVTATFCWVEIEPFYSSAVAYWLHMQTDTTIDDCISTGVLRNTMAVCIVYFDVYYPSTYHSSSDTIRIMFVICFVCTKLMWSL